tara:strand:+ start:60 stop:419 length:360 start_codon:yes stop_codon:yes gene_type:complete
MSIEEKFKSAAGIIIILFILLYVFNFSFFANLIIFLIGTGLLFVTLVDADADADEDNPGAQLKKIEDQIYSQINQEMTSGDIKPNLWTKAEALSDGGSEQAVKSKYIKLRFEQIKEDGF